MFAVPARFRPSPPIKTLVNKGFSSGFGPEFHRNLHLFGSPVVRANCGTRWLGIRWQSCRRSENLLAVGLCRVCSFMPHLVAGPRPASQPFFIPQSSNGVLLDRRGRHMGQSHHRQRSARSGVDSRASGDARGVAQRSMLRQLENCSPDKRSDGTAGNPPNLGR